jgi:hypothetical protein
MPSLRAQGGYAILWILVLVATLLAVVAASLQTTNNLSAVDSTAPILRSLGVGVNAFELQIGKFPGAVSQFTTVVTTADHSTCHATVFTTANVTTGGPRGPSPRSTRRPTAS